jgi:Uma2 family endonuclease
MTAEELAALPDDGGHHVELVRGELVSMAPSAALPGVVSANVLLTLGPFVRQHQLGVVGTADSGFLLSTNPDTVRAPDVWFVRSERVPASGIPQTFWPGAPDLAVEVLSPTDRFGDVLRKAQDYLDAGTLLVWVIDPAGRSAAVFQPEGRPLLLSEDGVLDGGAVLPGFAVRLRDLLP